MCLLIGLLLCLFIAAEETAAMSRYSLLSVHFVFKKFAIIRKYRITLKTVNYSLVSPRSKMETLVKSASAILKFSFFCGFRDFFI